MITRYKHLHILIFMCLLAGICVSCAEEEGGPVQTVSAVDDSDLTEAVLSLNVTSMGTSSSTTKADDEDDVLSDNVTDEELRGTDQERRINNIWVFQFDASTGSLLITPQYYDISDLEASPDELEENAAEVNVLLKPNVASTVYVVANVNKSEWATVSNAYSLSAVKAMTIPQPDYVYIDTDEDDKEFTIPMEGGVNVTPTPGETIKVQVTRMYAKLEIELGDIPESVEITAVDVYEIPFYCQVGTLETDDPTVGADYPDDVIWTQQAFNPGTKGSDGTYSGTMVIYIPENLQGRNDNTENDSSLKTENAPSNGEALYVDFTADLVDIFTGDIKESGRQYIVYPGANNYNDYNIKRNFIYRITLNIYTDQYNQDIPSSNCFVVKPGQTLSFLPYYRTETGGGYDFTDYLDAYGDDETKKINDSETMTDNIKIIWQTKDAIGDNSNGDLVWVDRLADATDEFHRKIHVKAGEAGNALVAAYNSDGEIVWSWHIWVTDNDPANVSNAIVYSTYSWDKDGVYPDVRVPGYSIMPCNLGALKNEPDDINTLDPDTHGMLYQWGRKDPFPPARALLDSDYEDYSDTYTGVQYGNDNTTAVTKTWETTESYLFHSLAGNKISSTTDGDPVGYTIKHPTVFIRGTPTNNYDWMGDLHDDCLWGGEDPSTTGGMKYLTVNEENNIHIFDNYGSSKSIFDPCPDGWRVPPGDLWLGFTSTGLNPTSYDEINTATAAGGAGAGMYMYMTDWKSGKTAFFPTQGFRVSTGKIYRAGVCGNYLNATADLDDRVNYIHIHRTKTYFKIFETAPGYVIKSTGSSVRCVRDHK